MKRLAGFLFVSVMAVLWVVPSASADVSTSISLWNTSKYDSEIGNPCSRPYGPRLIDSYESVSIDAAPIIEAPTDVLTITVSFDQECYDRLGDKYERSLSLVSPNGTVYPLTRNSEKSSKYERTWSEYCQFWSGGCWIHRDVYRIRIGSQLPSGAYGLKFQTNYEETVSEYIDGAWVSRDNVPQSHSFEVQKLFSLEQTGKQAAWEVGEEVTGEMLLQRAGSQVFLTSEDMEGDFRIYEDGVLLDDFSFDEVTKAHVIEQRVTGAIEVKKVVNDKELLVPYKDSKGLLWFENVNLGSFSETQISDKAWVKVSYLAEHKFLYSGVWLPRESKVTKFICTGIHREGASRAEQLSARKRAKLACELGKEREPAANKQISFWYQTKATKASSYVGKVLVTVKGIEPFVLDRLK